MIVQEYTVVDEIIIFHGDIDADHRDYRSEDLDLLYAEEERHFWFIARKKFIFQRMKSYFSYTNKIIEIGAGTGNVSRYLLSNGYRDISVGEMHVNGLHYAKRYGIQQCYQFDLLRNPFRAEFDLVCMFDVLEHIDNDELAIRSAHEMLNCQGHIVLTVPAHKWLWSRADRVAGHKTRYNKKELLRKLERNGFDILEARYFFISIVPLLYLRKLINRDDGLQIDNAEHGRVMSTGYAMNKLLLFISNIENKINFFVPNLFGGSLFVVAKKK